MYGFDPQQNPGIDPQELLNRQNADPTQALESGAQGFRSAVGSAAQGQQDQFSGLQQEMIRQQQQQQAQQPGGVRRFFAGMLSGMGAAAMKQATGETPEEAEYRRAQTFSTLQNAELMRQQAQRMMMPVEIPDFSDPTGQRTRTVPAFLAEKMLPQVVMSQGRVQAAEINKRYVPIPNVGVLDTQNPQGPSMVPGSGPNGITITPDIAQDNPAYQQLIGKTIPIQQFAAMQRGEAFQNQVVQTASGPVVTNRSTGKSKPVTINGVAAGNPGIAVAQARAYYGAKYGMAMTPEYDENGEPTGRFMTTNRLSLLQSGAPSVSTPNMKQVAQPWALVSDMAGAIENVRQSGAQIDWSAANRAKMVAALGDSTTGPGEFLRGEVARSMTPQERQYVVDVKIAQEALQSLRPILGAGQGSDLQRKLGLATNPGAQTPDNSYLNMQIDALGGMLKRVSTGFPKLGKPGTTGQGQGFGGAVQPKADPLGIRGR